MTYPFKNNPTQKKNYPNPNKKKPTQIKSNHSKQIRDFYQKTTLVDFTMEFVY